MWYITVKAWNKTVEVFKNPTPTDIAISSAGVRGIIDTFYNLYLWNGEVFHEAVKIPDERWIITASHDIFWIIEVRNFACQSERLHIVNNLNMLRFFGNKCQYTFY